MKKIKEEQIIELAKSRSEKMTRFAEDMDVDNNILEGIIRNYSSASRDKQLKALKKVGRPFKAREKSFKKYADNDD